jgi:cell division transport system permease protein
MRALEYAFRQGAASLWRSRASAAFAVLAIALALVVLGVLLVLTWNIERLLSRWTASAEVSVYLADGATSEQRGAIEAMIDRSGVAAGREYVSKADALTRFRREFAELAALAEGFEDNPFPASIEVRVASSADQGGRVDALVAELVKQQGVVDVRYDREWLSRIGSALDTFRAGGLALGVLMAVAAAVTVATVVRLGLHARRDEIEIMELVGAPWTYIRGPFVAEGFLQGGTGALIAMLCLWLVLAVVNAWWGTELRAILEGEVLHFLPFRLAALLVLGGMAVGSAGGLLASWRVGSNPR